MRPTIQARLNQKHAEVLIERVKVDILNRQFVFMKPIQLTSTLGGTYMDPVGCPVTGSGKTLFVNKSPQEYRFVAIDVLPVN